MISQVSQLRLKGFRFPRSIISYAVWAYHRFALSLRDVEDLLAERGVIVSYESIRVWCQRFGPQIAAKIRRDRPAPSGKWHLDEVVISIRGKTLALAGGRRERRRIGYLGAKPQKCSGCQAVPEKADEAMGRATRARN